MPAQKDVEHKFLRPWETVAEAVWKRYPAAARFSERKEINVTSKVVMHHIIYHLCSGCAVSLPITYVLFLCEDVRPIYVCAPQRCSDTFALQRLGASMTTAIIERTVTYNFSECVPLLLKTFVGSGESFVMREILTFNWPQRKLEVEVTNETGIPQLKYTERTLFTVHPENELWTLMKQTGYYEVDVMFGMHHLGSSACEDIYHLSFTHNR